MTVFDVTEKQQKSHFFFRFFIEIFVKSTFPAKFSPSLAVNFFALIRCSVLVHIDLALIFNITTALHAGK